jgi:hypothetical protein
MPRLTPEQRRQAIREILTAWNSSRAAWIEQNGTDAGFNDWFSRQIGI